MPDSVSPEVVTGFRELLHEFRGVGNALGEVVERTARLETKVDRLVEDQAVTAGMQSRLCGVENWVRDELAARNAVGLRRGLWVGAIATIVGGVLGAVMAHFWK